MLSQMIFFVGSCLQVTVGGFTDLSEIVITSWGFPKMVGFPNWPIGFPTKNDQFGVFWGYHHLRKHPVEYFFLIKAGPLLTPHFQAHPREVVYHNIPR